MRTFTGEALREVAFPLGGIGTGTVSLGGRGNLRDWEVFNRPSKGRDLPYTFFSVWARPEGGSPVARIAERRLLPPYIDGRGLLPGKLCGLPRLAEATFRGEYPLAWIDYRDESLPVELSLCAWNPMTPLDADASGIPGAVFDWTVRNPGERAVEVTLAFSLLNATGYDGRAELTTRRHELFGQNRNEWVEAGGVRGIRMSTGKYAADHPQFGSMALLTDWTDVTYLLHWERAGWWDDLQNFWDDFSSDGRLSDDPASDESPTGQTDVGSVGLRVRLGAGESATLPFYLGWHFPNLTNYWNREEAVKGQRIGNYYATQFANGWEAASALQARRTELEAGTREFHRALTESTLPEEVIDAVSSQMSIIRTTTCLRTEDGRFHAFEGCNDNSGCCPMDCTHVWNYEQALAFLFPELERSMRLTDFGVNTREDGRMSFRTLLPLAAGTLWGGPPAADGQMGCILKLYREWRLCGDDAWLRSLWPHAKQALQFAWQKWDADRDGVMEGEQHNTYDIEFYGPNTMMGTLYLAALRASARMARHLGEEAFAAECERLDQQGSRLYDEKLWNGEYYVQEVLTPSEPAEGLGEGTQSLSASGELRYQYGPGCLSDQMLGQWFAHVVGLGHVLPVERVRSTMAAVHRHNFRRDLTDHASCQRTYALNDEAGLLLCTWPNGGRPRYPFPYADEVWTGIEYQVAAHLIYEGLVEEGLEIVRGVRARHDGVRRNPWDEFECGHHYARALASWSVLLALSGFDYDAGEGRLRVAPRIAEGEFRCFFSTGTAWGTVALGRRSETGRAAGVRVLGGDLTVTRWDGVGTPDGGVSASAEGQTLNAWASEGGVRFDPPVVVAAGQELVVFAA
jgi:non-lysosomal glucosylceramidase